MTSSHRLRLAALLLILVLTTVISSAWVGPWVALVLGLALGFGLGWKFTHDLEQDLVSVVKLLPHPQSLSSSWLRSEFEPLRMGLSQILDSATTTTNDLLHNTTQLQSQLETYKQTSNQILQKDQELSGALLSLQTNLTAISAAKQSLEAVLFSITDGIVGLDVQRRISYVNQVLVSLTGYTQAEMIGQPLDSLFKLYGADGTQLAIQNYAPISTHAHEPLTFSAKNILVKAKADHQAYVHLNAQSILETGNQNIGCVLTFRDVTKEQDLEKMKLDFVSMAAHELRTPLTTVQGYLSFLQMPETANKLGPEEKDFLSRAFQSATRLNKLIENLLEVTRIEQGRMTIKAQRTRLEPIIEHMTQDFIPVATQKQLKLTYLPPKTPLPDVMIDPIRIEEVISNLISNAIKYVDKGEVKVFMEVADNTVITSVADSGHGIAPEAQVQLFTKFYRVESNITAGAKGTGLGLYLCKNIIESHGGNIWVESEVGKGSVFSFSVPIA